MTRRGTWSLAVAVLTAGCGFHPLYEKGGASSSLSSIYVNIIPNRPGQLLRQAIQARLEGEQGSAAKHFTLSVTYFEVGQGVGIEANNFTTRTRSMGTAVWSLHPADNAGAQLTGGTVRSIDGYNLLNEQYFYADLSEEAVQRRLAEALADQISLGLSLYFEKHAKSTQG
jgi:LPS-assembly lipoprotein